MCVPLSLTPSLSFMACNLSLTPSVSGSADARSGFAAREEGIQSGVSRGLVVVIVVLCPIATPFAAHKH